MATKSKPAKHSQKRGAPKRAYVRAEEKRRIKPPKVAIVDAPPTTERRMPVSTVPHNGEATALNEDRINIICASILNGAPPHVAAVATKVTERSYRRWYSRGEAEYDRIDGNIDAEITPGEEPYLYFFVRVNEALASCEANMVGHVVSAASNDWRAGAWYLERRIPDRYRQQQAIVGAGGAPLPGANAYASIMLVLPDNGRNTVEQVESFQRNSQSPSAVLNMPPQNLLSQTQPPTGESHAN